MLPSRKRPEIEVSKISAKGQVTVPQSVREFLSIKSGDIVCYIVSGSQVILKKAEPLDLEYLKALELSLSEWDSPEDNNAYNNL